MTSKGSIGLLNFFIFNSKYGPREGEEEKKIMFYSPEEADIDTKVKNIGLAEAIAQFSATFSEIPCQSVHTQKTRQLLLQPEAGFWVVMTVSHPFQEKTKDGTPYLEYREDDVQDSVFQAVLDLAYKMFKLFNGTFEHILMRADGDVEVLKQRLEGFYNKYLLTLRLSQCDLLDVFNGIHFLPLDKNTYLRIQCFINRLEATFPFVKYTAFLYNDKLVWSGLEQDDMRTLYQYLTTTLFPTYMAQEHQGGGQVKSQAVGASQYCKFLTGPPDLTDERSMGKLPRVFVSTETDNEEFYLLVYRAMSATICLLVNVKCPLNVPMCRKLDAMMAPQMTKLASDIKEQHYQRAPPQSAADPVYKYIYFNHMNLAQQTTMHTDLQKQAGITIPQEIMRLLNDINADLAQSNTDGETIVKTTSDFWVVGKKSDTREFYVVINQKNANLIEINEEVKRLCTSHLNSIFFLD
ncbi:vacuolar fusion protein CCZ1 homolog [Pomacea canaliculata]|uniref:vacuolar fusion protein CCZ1 homolog n=1 Tax=Pomacea canaliculata TaxID=400727 RepID=UPI000D7392B5|nr:vacuolar fusion protein CCZ1 homolog [Pomacea canaliculata]